MLVDMHTFIFSVQTFHLDFILKKYLHKFYVWNKLWFNILRPNNIKDERYALFFNMMGFGPNCIKGTNVLGSV